MAYNSYLWLYFFTSSFFLDPLHNVPPGGHVLGLSVEGRVRKVLVLDPAQGGVGFAHGELAAGLALARGRGVKEHGHCAPRNRSSIILMNYCKLGL